MKINSVIMSLACLTTAVCASAAPADFSFKYAEHKAVYHDADIDNDDMSMSGNPLNLIGVSINMMYPEQFGNHAVSGLQTELLRQSGMAYESGVLSLAEPPSPTASVTSLPADTPCGQTLDFSAFVSTLTGDLAVWTISGYYYAGGAHGFPSCKYLNYSIADDKVLAYDNLFKPGFRTATNRIIREYLSDNYTDILLTPVNNINTPDTFRINPDRSITFIFVPYEIAPYSAGFIEVPVYGWQIEDNLIPIGKRFLLSDY